MEALTAEEPAGPHHPGSFSAREAAQVVGVDPLQHEAAVSPSTGAQQSPQAAHHAGITVMQAESGGVTPLETDGKRQMLQELGWEGHGIPRCQHVGVNLRRQSTQGLSPVCCECSLILCQ